MTSRTTNTTTFGRLNRLANRFANLCREVGVVRSDGVAIALENSTELVEEIAGVGKIDRVALRQLADREGQDAKPVVR